MKKVIITGASRGIGKATAEKFLSEGWEVVGTSTSGQGWEHSNLSWVQLDLANPQSIALAAKTIAGTGSIDALIDNSGIYPEEGGRLDMQKLRRTLEVNLIGTIDFTEQLLGSLATHASVVLLGSGMGSISEVSVEYGVPDDEEPSYRVSKAAISMYGRTLALRLRERGITVSIADPGWVKTDMGTEEAPRDAALPAQEIFDLVTKKVPTGRFWRQGKERAW
jgi:NAD(P)-dependent dehydrogenase (short-subunit alcohol dehydrogenase family)